MTAAGSASPPDVDEVVDALAAPLPADPGPSTVRAHRDACRAARRALEDDPTVAVDIAVPIARTLRDDVDRPTSGGAASMFGIDVSARAAAAAASDALDAVPVWRLVGTAELAPFVAAVAAVVARPRGTPGRDAAASAFERAAIYAPDVVAGVLDDAGPGSEVAAAVTPLPDAGALDAPTARILVALVHARQGARLPDLDPLVVGRQTPVDPVVASRVAVLDATVDPDGAREGDDGGPPDDPVGQVRGIAPGLFADGDARGDDGDDEPDQGGDSTVTPPHPHEPLRTDDANDDDGTDAGGFEPVDVDPLASTNTDGRADDPGVSTRSSGTASATDPSGTADADTDPSGAVDAVTDALAFLVASDRASAAVHSRAFDALLAATTTATREAVHALGVLASLDALPAANRDALRDHLVERLAGGDVFDAFDRATRGRRVAFMEHHDERPAALAAREDVESAVTPAVLAADVLSSADYERIADALVDAIAASERSYDEQRTLGWLTVHADVPGTPLDRLRALLVERLDGDADDRDRALRTITAMAGYGVLDGPSAATVHDELVAVVASEGVADVPKTAGRAVSALLTADAFGDEHVTALVDAIPRLLDADVVPPATTGARTLAALAATERLPAERVEDVLGFAIQLCTVDEGGAESVSLRVAAVHALQGLATNYDVPPDYRKHVLGGLSIAARGDERHVDQSRRAALEGFRVVSAELDLPEFDPAILLPVVETALVQLLPGDRFEERPGDGTGPGPSASRLTTLAGETLRRIVQADLLDSALFAGVLSIDRNDATWVKNYPPEALRANRSPRLGRFLAPDNPAVPPFLEGVAAAAARDPGSFAAARPTLQRFLARTDPSPAVAASALEVLPQLPARPARAGRHAKR